MVAPNILSLLSKSFTASFECTSHSLKAGLGVGVQQMAHRVISFVGKFFLSKLPSQRSAVPYVSFFKLNILFLPKIRKFRPKGRQARINPVDPLPPGYVPLCRFYILMSQPFGYAENIITFDTS